MKIIFLITLYAVCIDKNQTLIESDLYSRYKLPSFLSADEAKIVLGWKYMIAECQINTYMHLLSIPERVNAGTMSFPEVYSSALGMPWLKYLVRMKITNLIDSMRESLSDILIFDNNQIKFRNTYEYRYYLRNILVSELKVGSIMITAKYDAVYIDVSILNNHVIKKISHIDFLNTLCKAESWNQITSSLMQNKSNL